ncbi:MAG: hypothetical protein ACRYF3_15005 [Janthinobacterium lividum]
MLRGTHRWALLGVATFYSWFSLASGGDDRSLYVFAVLSWVVALRGLRMGVELTDHEVRHVGLLRTRRIHASAVVSVHAHVRSGASAPLLQLRNDRRFFCYALSSGDDRCEKHTAALRRHLHLHLP